MLFPIKMLALIIFVSGINLLSNDENLNFWKKITEENKIGPKSTSIEQFIYIKKGEEKDIIKLPSFIKFKEDSTKKPLKYPLKKINESDEILNLFSENEKGFKEETAEPYVKDFLATLEKKTTTKENMPCLEMNASLGNTKSFAVSPSQEICDSSECIYTASTILKWMDQSANPCDNFYKFACGNFLKNEIIPDEKKIFENLDQWSDKIKLIIRKNIESDIKENDPKIFKQIQSFYNICMDTVQIHKSSEDDLREIFRELGGWPVLEKDSWNDSNFDWKKTIFDLHRIGYSISKVPTLISFGKKIYPAYSDFLIDIALFLGANQDQAKKELKEVLIFEFKLSKIFDPKEKIQNPISVKNLQSMFPYISWVDYASELLAPYISKKTLSTINVLLDFDLALFFKLIYRTSKRTIANYMMWRIAVESSDYMGGRAKKLAKNFIALFNIPQEPRKPTWKTCLESLEKKLPLGLGALYVRKNFEKGPRENVILLTKLLKKSFSEVLFKADWMDKKTKQDSIEKLDYISERIAYPDEFLNNNDLDEYYQNLKIYPNNFLRSLLSLDHFSMMHEVNLLEKRSNRSHWIFYGQSTIVNAFYNQLSNSIEISSAILQGIFYSKDRPQCLNYGAIGYIISHELSHAFDDYRRLFDKIGNFREWWQEVSTKEYKERSQCIINQYDNYIVEEVGLKIKGSQTLGENIADIVGIKNSYHAYLAWEKENKIEPRLPGLNYTSRQLFWISATNVWCAKFQPESLKKWIHSNTHSPHEYRVIGMFSNMHEFTRDFNCLPNSRMNPLKKFGIWR